MLVMITFIPVDFTVIASWKSIIMKFQYHFLSVLTFYCTLKVTDSTTAPHIDPPHLPAIGEATWAKAANLIYPVTLALAGRVGAQVT